MQRNNVIDIAKGIAIILMVVGHCDDLPEVVRYFIYSFHMPLFFIFSGYFFRKRGGMDCVKNSARGLLKPYLIVSIVGVLLATLLYGAEGFKEQLLGCILANGGAAFFGERMPTTGPMWFLVALFWCRLFYDYLVSKTHRPLLWSFVISTVAFAIGYFITNLPFGILYGCASLTG